MNLDRDNAEVIKFIKNVEDYWIKIKEANSKAANSRERSNRKIVAQWHEVGIDIDILLSLLNNPSNAVKLSAAAYLLNSTAKEEAISVLRNLKKNDPSLISPSAAAVLRLNNIALE